MAVDTVEGIISHIQADFADGRDSQYLPSISMQVQNRLKRNELSMTDLLADAGYSNGSNYNFLEKRKITMNKSLPFKGFQFGAVPYSFVIGNTKYSYQMFNSYSVTK